MALPARVQTISRRAWLLASSSVAVSRIFAADSLGVSWDGDNIHIHAPELHFLAGRPLEQLKNGATVFFLSQLSLFTDNFQTIYRRVTERFVVSYDVWEERFSATKLGNERHPISNLTAAAVEAWCVENMAISSSGLTPSRQFWLRFELRTTDSREQTDLLGESGINLTRLVEIFSRPPSSQQSRWVRDAGPLRLAGLRRVGGRTSRNG
jgi:hypothetical protein